MALRSRKPTSAGRRFQTVSDFAELTTDRPEKSLLAPKPRTGGRNDHGRKTSRHRGGGHKQQYRVIDFKRDKDGIPAKVATIEYDPNRNARIALAPLPRRREALHPRAGRHAGRRQPAVRPGRRDPAGQRAADALHPGRLHHPQRRAPCRPGRQDGPWRRHERAARGQGRRLRHPRLPSTEMRRVPIDCRATLGIVGTPRTSSSRSARPAATDGRVYARRPVVSR